MRWILTRLPFDTMKPISFFMNQALSKQIVLAAFGVLAYGPMAHAAQLLVNWSGNYVSSPQPFNGTYTYQSGFDFDGIGGTNDSRFGYAYNAGSPTLLSPSTGYSGTSDNFYGGFVINTLNVDSNGDTLQPNAHGVHDDGVNDHIKIQTQHSGNHHHTFALLTYWDKTDFLAATNTSVILDSNSAFTLSTLESSNFQPNAHLHFVIRNGSQFYVSQAYWGGTNLLDTDRQGDLPDGGSVVYNPFTTGLNWKLYNPNGLDLQWTHGSYDYTSSSFTDITAFGFYVDTLNFTQNNSNLEIGSFAVTAIPEPSRALLLMAGLMGVLLKRRRR